MTNVSWQKSGTKTLTVRLVHHAVACDLVNLNLRKSGWKTRACSKRRAFLRKVVWPQKKTIAFKSDSNCSTLASCDCFLDCENERILSKVPLTTGSS